MDLKTNARRDWLVGIIVAVACLIGGTVWYGISKSSRKNKTDVVIQTVDVATGQAVSPVVRFPPNDPSWAPNVARAGQNGIAVSWDDMTEHEIEVADATGEYKPQKLRIGSQKGTITVKLVKDTESSTYPATLPAGVHTR